MSELRQDYTALIPAPYPDFLTRRLKNDEVMPLVLDDVEQVEISTPAVAADAQVTVQLRGIYVE